MASRIKKAKDGRPVVRYFLGPNDLAAMIQLAEQNPEVFAQNFSDSPDWTPQQGLNELLERGFEQQCLMVDGWGDPSDWNVYLATYTQAVFDEDVARAILEIADEYGADAFELCSVAELLVVVREPKKLSTMWPTIKGNGEIMQQAARALKQGIIEKRVVTEEKAAHLAGVHERYFRKLKTSYPAVWKYIKKSNGLI